jgi:hypothetical protein
VNLEKVVLPSGASCPIIGVSMSEDVVEQPKLPVFAPGEKVCGNCRLWRANSLHQEKGWVGDCRLQANRGLFPPSAPICDKFSPRGEAVVTAAEEEIQRRRVLRNVAPVVRSARGFTSQAVVIDGGNDEIDIEGTSMTKTELMQLFLDAAGLTEVPLAQKWEGATMKLVPANPQLQSKDLPVDALFHKVVMVRDRLRTLEMKLNAHPKLSDAEKVEMQQYVTRCYGSLTSFNVLFKDKDDQFVGQKGDD